MMSACQFLAVPVTAAALGMLPGRLPALRLCAAVFLGSALWRLFFFFISSPFLIFLIISLLALC